MTAEFLTPRLGQSVFVENKAGAGSQIGIDLGYQATYLPGDEFKAFVMKDADQWKGVAKSAKISLE